MQNTSQLYKDLLGKLGHGVYTETRLSIGENGRLIDQTGDAITFGGVSILTGSSGPENGFDESVIVCVETDLCVFSNNSPAVGCCAAGEISVRMIKPIGTIPRRARLVPYVRLTDGTRHSEWIQKGVFFIDTRTEDDSGSKTKWLELRGYDSMLMAEVDYPLEAAGRSDLDIDIVRHIAEIMGVSLDARTAQIMILGYHFPYQSGYSCREMLGYIAAAYGGCFVMNDDGELRLMQINAVPKETSCLITNDGTRSAITFGGDRILV